MTGSLLDTNFLSELRCLRPEGQAIVGNVGATAVVASSDRSHIRSSKPARRIRER